MGGAGFSASSRSRAGYNRHLGIHSQRQSGRGKAGARGYSGNDSKTCAVSAYAPKERPLWVVAVDDVPGAPLPEVWERSFGHDDDAKKIRLDLSPKLGERGVFHRAYIAIA